MMWARGFIDSEPSFAGGWAAAFFTQSPRVMQTTPRLLLNAFLSRDVAELRAIRDNAFTMSANNNGQGTLIASTVNGSSFTFSAPGLATLTPIQIMSLAQQALDMKANCITRPITRTRAWFI